MTVKLEKWTKRKLKKKKIKRKSSLMRRMKTKQSEHELVMSEQNALFSAELDTDIATLKVLSRHTRNYIRFLRRYAFAALLFIVEDIPTAVLTFYIARRASAAEIKSTAFLFSVFTTCAGMGLKLNAITLIPRIYKTLKWYRRFTLQTAASILEHVKTDCSVEQMKENHIKTPRVEGCTSVDIELV